MKSHSTKQIIIIFGIIILLLLGLHYFVFYFIKSTAIEVLNIERDIKSTQAQVIEFSKYTPEDLNALARSVSAKFISSGDFVEFIQGIETKGRAQNLVVTVRSVATEPRSADSPNDDKEILRLQLETRGSWADTLRFVYYLEHLPYKIAVRQLKLVKSANGSGEAVANREDATNKENVTDNSWKAEIEITALKIK